MGPAGGSDQQIWPQERRQPAAQQVAQAAGDRGCRLPPSSSPLEDPEETLGIMRDAETMNRLAESDVELARGEYVTADELAKAMRRRRAQ